MNTYPSENTHHNYSFLLKLTTNRVFELQRKIQDLEQRVVAICLSPSPSTIHIEMKEIERLVLQVEDAKHRAIRYHDNQDGQGYSIFQLFPDLDRLITNDMNLISIHLCSLEKSLKNLEDTNKEELQPLVRTFIRRWMDSCFDNFAMMLSHL